MDFARRQNASKCIKSYLKFNKNQNLAI